jgi:drug/metabolite transporter (DMT)-like permease
MLVGGAALLATSLAVGEMRAAPDAATTLLAVAYLATLGSVGLFGAYLFVLGRWTASGASYSIVLMPLVTVLLGAALRGELVTPAFLIGAVLVAIGVYVGALRAARG